MINCKEVAVIIPIYRNRPTEDEIVSIKRNSNILKRRDIYFIAPQSLNLEKYAFADNIKVKKFPDIFFNGLSGYNRLMMSSAFYKTFQEYNYILIAQTDSLIISGEDQITNFISWGYDYIGAPWYEPKYRYVLGGKGHIIEFINKLLCKKKVKCYVGNGGFSLRKVDSTIRLLTKCSISKCLWKDAEDIFFAVHGSSINYTYKVAPLDKAGYFSRENHLGNENLPYAVHGWKKSWKYYDYVRALLLENI